MFESPTSAVRTAAVSVLCEVGWLARQPAALRQAILEMGFLRRRARPGPLYRAADSSTALFAVVRGAVRVEFPLGGEEFLLHIGGPGFWFGQVPLVTGGQRVVSATAEADTVLFEVPATPFKALLAREPEHWRSIADLSTEQLVHALRVVAELLNLPPSTRIARRLLDRIGNGGQVEGRAEIPISQGDLAALVGLSRQRLNWHLQEMGRCGLIESGYGRLVVPDVARLRALASGA